MSLNEAQQLVSTARTGQLTLPASSYQVPQPTIATLPGDHTAPVTDQDIIPLTMLQQDVDEESTSTAGILAAAAAVATPLPAPPTIYSFDHTLRRGAGTAPVIYSNTCYCEGTTTECLCPSTGNAALHEAQETKGS
eukprot:6031478-Amphidinium_carterae.2